MIIVGSTINNCYSTGDVTGTNGSGFIGQTGATIENCYSTGSASAAGFTAANFGTVNNSYWDIEKSGQLASNGGDGKTTAEMDAIIAAGSWPEYEVAQPPPGAGTDFSVQIGNDGSDESLFSLGDLSLDLSSLSIDLTNISSSRTSLESIDEAINYMTEKRAYLGAGIGSLEDITNSNKTKELLLENSNSTIRDSNIAVDSARMLKNQILQQSTASLMKQSMQLHSEMVIGLLKF